MGGELARSEFVFVSLPASKRGPLSSWIQRRPVFSFYIFAYVYSWAIAVPLALQAQGIISARLPLAFHYLTAFGPALAAWTISVVLRRGQTW